MRNKDKEIVPNCDFCDKPALKTNGNSEYVCEKRALSGSCKGFEPLKSNKQQRNDKCACNSGKKFKNCCI